MSDEKPTDRPGGDSSRSSLETDSGVPTASLFLPLVYDELRQIAQRVLRRPDGASLQPTELVHEVYLKLARTSRGEWNSRAHFLAHAARAMRQILSDHVRRKLRVKRGGPSGQRVALSGLGASPRSVKEIDIVALDEALDTLSKVYPEQASIVEMRFLAGLTVDEVALVSGVPKRTVIRRWRMARAFLRRKLEDS